MWRFKEITREEFEARKDFVEQIMIRLGAEPAEYGKPHDTASCGNDFTKTHPATRRIYKYKHEYYRVDEILLWEKPCIVIEWTDRLDYIIDGANVMEDIDPFPYDLSDDQIMIEVTAALQPTDISTQKLYRTNRIAVLAERLYDMSIGLKRYDPSKLLWKKYRKECLHTLSAMQYIVQWMQKRCISENEAIEIVRVLDAYAHPQLTGYQARFLEAHAESDYSGEYYSLLSEMANILQFCSEVVTNSRISEYDKVWRAMRAFHNGPRAFLSVSNRMHCSLENARHYAGMK